MKRYSGVVRKGEGLGQKLGFPTANISIDDPSLSGIYAARVLLGRKTYSAAVFIDTKRKLLESHLLDFSGDLYGRTIEVELLEKIREGKHFETDMALSDAIADDVRRVRTYFVNL